MERWIGALRRALAGAARRVGRLLARIWRRVAFWLGLTGLFAPGRRIARIRKRLSPSPRVRRAGRRWGARIGGAVLAVNLLWLAMAAGVAYLWPLVSRLGGDAEWTEFERIADRSRAAALFDSEGRYFGILSAVFERDHLGGLSQEQIDQAEVVPDHKTIPVSDAPPYYWRCLAWLEDRNRGGWDNPFGISFRGVAQIPYRIIGGSLASGRLRLPGGGSTLEMQLARSLLKQYRHNSNPLLRKLREWRAAPVLNRRLIEEGGERRFRSWMAQHLALVQAAGGEQDVYGVEAAGRLVFGKSANALDAAEQILLAATVRRPLRLRASPDSRRRELAQLIGTPERPDRALLCASDEAVFQGAPVIPGAGLRGETRRKLLRLAREPFLGPTVDAGLAPYARRLMEHPAGPRLDPQRVAAELAYGVEVETVAALADAFAPKDEPDHAAHPWRGRLSGVRLTLDLAKNLALEREIDRAVEVIERGASQGAPPRLAESVLSSPARRYAALPDRDENPGLWLTPSVIEREERTPLLVVAADRQGRIRRLVTTSADSLYGGAAASRADWGFYGEGPYRVERERRTIGSIGKVGAALLLAETGLADPKAGLDNRCPRGLTRRCASAGGERWVTARRAFAQSLNAAVTNALAARVSDARIERLVRDLGFGDGGASALADPAPPPTSLALGFYVGRPLAAQRMMALALAYAEGDFGARPATPRLLDAYRPFDPAEDRQTAPGFEPFAVERTPLGAVVRPGPDPAGAAAFLRDVLQAPICDQGRDGRATLRRLRAWCALTNPNVALHIAKTGTVGAALPVNGYNETDWWIAGAIKFADGRAYTYVVAAGAGEPSEPFARDLGAGRLAPIVDALLRDLSDETAEP